MIVEVGVFNTPNVNLLNLQRRQLQLYRFGADILPQEITLLFHSPVYRYILETDQSEICLRIVSNPGGRAAFALNTDDIQKVRKRDIRSFLEKISIGGDGRSVPVPIDEPLYVLEKRRMLGVVWRPSRTDEEIRTADRIDHLQTITRRSLMGTLYKN